MKKIVTRIAPSPTGDPHVGTAYIGLFNYVFAKKNNGKFILRIEDTDRKRYSSTSEQQIFDAMHWLGLNYDEGPDCGGENGPYRQSERFDIYKKYAQELVEKGEAYYAFETEQELEEMKSRQKALGQPPMYDRRARKLTKEEVEQKLKDNIPYVIRLKMPYDGKTVVSDELRGDIYFDNDKLDDQVLLKSDGFPTYHLANIVDDHLMGVTDVIRAEEWITSTPKHVRLYEAFGWEKPRFYHMPLLRNKDKTKISKRHNPVSLNFYREEGYLPEAMLNFLALMGWSMPNSNEIFSIQEMIDNFSFDRISLGGPIFDLVKLGWINNQYMRKMDLDELTKMSVPYFENLGYKVEFSELKKIVEILRESATTIKEIAINADVFMNDDIKFDLNVEEMNSKERKSYQKMLDAKNHEKSDKINKMFIEKLNKLNHISNETITNLFHEIMEELDLPASIVMMNIRARLTGRPRGVDLSSLISVIGKERVFKRIER